MFGFGPISSTSISGDPFKLIAVPAALAGIATLTFSLEARIGAIAPMSGSATLTFSPSATMAVRQAISGSTSLTFTPTALLRVAGKPIEVSAVSVSYAARAMPGSYTAKSSSQSFTFRGAR